MQPFSRETIVDRRQPSVRWTAVVSGALVAGGVWLLLQLILTGSALASISPDDADRAHAFGLGTSVGSIIAPLIAMFLGGLVAGRLGGYIDRKVVGFHGALVWALASVVGVALLANVVGSIASNHMGAHHDATAVSSDSAAMVDENLAAVNAKLKGEGAPTIAKGDLLDAARVSIQGNQFDRDAFVRRLDEKTSLSRPEAEAAVEGFGADAGTTMLAASQIAAHREKVMRTAEHAGNAMVAAGVGLVLCLGAAIGGALLGSRRSRHRQGGVVATPSAAQTTAPYASAATSEPRGHEL